MKVTGIIAEYNPFHDGHRYHLQQTRERLKPDLLVVIVSGLFSSRGLPSLLLPEEKARLALQWGADLVLELPLLATLQSADRFARFALESLSAAGVDSICFGSETNDLEALEQAARAMENLKPDPTTSMARNSASQISFLGPNDILGVQYVRYATPLHIQCVPIERDQSFKSATQSRKDFFANPFQEEAELWNAQARWENLYPFLRLTLSESDPKDLRHFFLVEEGIENRLIKAAQMADSWDSFLESAISRTYSKARIQRTCLMILMQIKKEDAARFRHLFSLQVLGMNEKGKKWLADLNPDIPVYSRIRDLPETERKIDQKARWLYALTCHTPLPKWRIVIEKSDNPLGLSENV